MPSPFPRLLATFTYLRPERYPSKQELKRHLSELGHEVSDRSIERDLHKLKVEYRVEVAYNRFRQGYYITNNADRHVEEFTRLAEQFHSSDLLHKAMQQGTKALDFIDLNHRGDLRGEGFLDELYEAIANKKHLTLTYKSFDEPEAKDYPFSPWLLKYYQGRWYVAGETTNGFRIFGVDRIENVQVRKGKYIRYKGKAKDIFRHQIGIYGAGEEPVKILFKASPKHAQFLQTLRMHHSQKTLDTLPNGWVNFSLDVSINFELTQNFLMAGDRVIVQEPQALIDRMKNEISSMHGYYFKQKKH